MAHIPDGILSLPVLAVGTLAGACGLWLLYDHLAGCGLHETHGDPGMQQADLCGEPLILLQFPHRLPQPLGRSRKDQGGCASYYQ